MRKTEELVNREGKKTDNGIFVPPNAYTNKVTHSDANNHRKTTDDITEEEYIQIAMMVEQENQAKGFNDNDGLLDSSLLNIKEQKMQPIEDPKIMNEGSADDDFNTEDEIPSGNTESDGNDTEEDTENETTEDVPSPDGLSSADEISEENTTPIRIGNYPENRYPNLDQNNIDDLLKDIPGLHSASVKPNNPLGIQLKSALDLALGDREEVIDLEELENETLVDHETGLEIGNRTDQPYQKVDRLHAIRMIRSQHSSKNNQVGPSITSVDGSTGDGPDIEVTKISPVKELKIAPPMNLPFVSKAFIYYAHPYKHTTDTSNDCLFLFQWLGHTLNISGSIDIPLEIILEPTVESTGSARVVFLSKYGLTYEIHDDYTQKMLSYKVCNVSLMKRYIISVAYEGKISQHLAMIKFDPNNVEYYLEWDFNLTELKIANLNISDLKTINKTNDKGKEEISDIKKITMFFNSSVLLELDMDWEFQ